nr:hypothetical protein Iba_chr05cCG15760 [Ipomoea batatas]
MHFCAINGQEWSTLRWNSNSYQDFIKDSPIIFAFLELQKLLSYESHGPLKHYSTNAQCFAPITSLLTCFSALANVCEDIFELVW